MKNIKIIYLLILAHILIPSASGQVDTAFSNLATELYQKFAKKINNRAVVVGLYDQGNDTLLSYGRINMLGRIPDGNDVFQIGSISKTFTGLMFSKALMTEDLSLNDPLSKYIDVKKRSKYDSTSLLSLATHTSGLPNNTLTFSALPILSYVATSVATNQLLLIPAGAPDVVITLPWRILFVPPLVPFFSTYGRKSVNYDLNTSTPKASRIGQMKYSNLGYGVLGRVVADQYNLSYEEILQRDIAGPLGMNNTTTIPTKEQKKRFATPHNWLGIRTFRSKFKEGGIEGAGAIKSTGNDMMKYLEFQLKGFSSDPELSDAVDWQHETHFVSDNPKKEGLEMGLGWIKYNTPIDGRSTIIWHNGQVAGSSAFIGFIPDKKIGIFVLCNSSRFGKITRMAFRILNRMDQKREINGS